MNIRCVIRDRRGPDHRRVYGWSACVCSAQDHGFGHRGELRNRMRAERVLTRKGHQVSSFRNYLKCALWVQSDFGKYACLGASFGR